MIMETTSSIINRLNVINRLNENIYNLKDFDYNINFAEDLIWDDVNYVRNCDEAVRYEWLYGKELLLIEEQHENTEESIFGINLTWKQSYILGLLLAIWH